MGENILERLRNNHLLRYFSLDELIKIYEQKDMYIKAKIIVTELFKDKVDKAGKPYINHLFRVSDKLRESIEKVAGLLHDTLEDTDITYEDLISVGFTCEVLDIVKIVTNNNDSSIKLSREEKLRLYHEKIDKMIDSNNIHAIRLKEADMSDNYDLTRLKELPIDMQEWFVQKYEMPLSKLRIRLGKVNALDT